MNNKYRTISISMFTNTISKIYSIKNCNIKEIINYE